MQWSISDDDEFDDFTEPSRAMGRCRAVFAYQGSRDDELTIAEGK